MVSVFGLWLVLWSAGASAAVLQADGYSDLQAAVDAASDGDTIQLSASDYLGPVIIDGKDLVIEGVGANSRLYESGAVDNVVSIRGMITVTLKGLTVDGEGSSRGIGVTDSSLYLEDVVVTGGVNPDGEMLGGAGLRAEGADVDIVDSVFSNNDAGSGFNGGHIGVQVGKNLTIGDPKLSISYSDFSTGNAETGGGIFVSKGCDLEIDSSIFSDNTALSGAAVFMGNPQGGVIADSSFNNNEAYDSGGALYFYLGSAEIRDSFFASNSAIVIGGSILSEGADLSIVRSSFSFGAAESGGAIGGTVVNKTSEPVTVIEDCSFTKNSATENGGAISLTNADTTEIRRSSFCLNTAVNGGSVYLWEANSITASNNSFVEEAASAAGSAMFLDIFGVASVMHNVALTNSIGAFSFISGDVDFNHNIVAYSSGANAVQGSSAAMVADYNAYLDNVDGDSDSGIGINSSPFLGVDPLFIAYSADGDCSNDDLSLAPGSPLIDAGDPGQTGDLDGTTADLGLRGGPEADLDWDEDGHDYPDDCEDLDATIHPGSLTACDGVDSDCDGLFELDEDADQDGHVSLTCGGDDCDDTDNTRYVGAAALCDGKDNDCDGSLEVEDDVDGDGELDLACGGTDCDDDDDTVGEGMTEYCDGVDNNCDGNIDEPGAVDGVSYIEDIDMDGFGGMAVTAVAVGPYNGCALGGDGSIHCWGTGSYGVDEPPAGTYATLSVGYYHGCALTVGGELDCWSTGGVVDQGQASPPAGVFEQLGAGKYHSCALDSQGEITCWGIDDASNFDFGQVTDTPSGSGFVELSVGSNHNCAVDASAELQCWGLDDDGQATPPAGGPFSEVSAGTFDGCALDAAGEIQCWGASSFSPPAGSYTLVEVGRSVACAQDSADLVVCFADSGSSIVTDIPSWPMSSLVLGDEHACGVNLAKGVVCWGEDSSQFGLLESGLGPADLYCEPPVAGNWVTDRTDCVADDVAIYPGADEYCDTIDNDCDGEVAEAGSLDGSLYYVDGDQDNFGDDSDPGERYCSVPTDLVADNTDCDDGDVDIFPGGTEVCDNEDNDCDGDIDEEGSADGELYYVDADNDDYGDVDDSGTRHCDPPVDLVDDNTDCDDTDIDIHPGSTEVCDGDDNDCDGDTDDADSSWDTSTGVPGYADADLDGYGDPSQPLVACDYSEGFVANDEDCDDSNGSVYPNQPEDCSTNVDDNCDGYFADCNGEDTDGDGFCAYPWGAGTCDDPSNIPGDCNDSDPTIYPAAPEICDSLDNNCDGAVDELPVDLDGDGFSAVGACTGTKDDCNDYLASTYPGAEELCNGIDDDCNGLVDDDPLGDLNLFVDSDGDGFGSEDSCNLPPAEIDCDDGDELIFPGAVEDLFDGIDNDCDTFADHDPVNVDNDLDGYCEGSDASLCQSQVTVKGTFDCDDADPTRAPDKDELPDGIDNDCDGYIDNDNTPGKVDQDGDGYCANPGSCGTGSSLIPGDCNDFDPDIHPDAEERCNGRDDNCDGLIWDSIDERDLDGDGFMACEEPSGKPADCDDSDALVFPGQVEDCQDMIDNDCDGYIDQMLDLDGDGHYTCFDDCDDSTPAAYFGNTEICDAIDNDCDGFIDEGFDADGDGFMDCNACSATHPDPVCDCNDANALIRPGIAEDCSDGVDNDCDGLTDQAGDSDFDQVDRCNGDCEDTDPDINPLKPEICDGIDNNCNGEIDEGYDRDGDGFYTCFGDCEDDPDVGGEYAHVGLDEDDPEDCDELDNDCNGVVDDLWPDLDLDGYTECQGDCDNEEGTSSPGAEEVCDDNIDNDCDGDIDVADLDCEIVDTAAEPSTEFTGEGARPAWFCGVSVRPSPPWAVLLLGLMIAGRRRENEGLSIGERERTAECRDRRREQVLL
jgi:predicted outer membrane repeat protein